MKTGTTLMLWVMVVLFAGCTQRTITVTSEPPGALVYLNDEEVGRTPLTVPFTFYGVYDVRLELDGHKSLWTKQEAVAPWWEFSGPDLLAEMSGARSELFWHFQLQAATEADQESLIDHAKQMRALMKQEIPN